MCYRRLNASQPFHTSRERRVRHEGTKPPFVVGVVSACRDRRFEILNMATMNTRLASTDIARSVSPRGFLADRVHLHCNCKLRNDF